MVPAHARMGNIGQNSAAVIADMLLNQDEREIKKALDKIEELHSTAGLLYNIELWEKHKKKLLAIKSVLMATLDAKEEMEGK